MSKTYSYTIHLEPAQEGGYTVTVPALPGVVTEGDTYEQSLAMAREAIELHLESLVADGEPVPREQPLTRPVDTRVEVQAPAAV